MNQSRIYTVLMILLIGIALYHLRCKQPPQMKTAALGRLKLLPEIDLPPENWSRFCERDLA